MSQSFDKILASLTKKVLSLEENPASTNRDRRRLHAEVSLAELDVEDDSSLSQENRSERAEKLKILLDKLVVKFVKREGILTIFLDLLDEAVRIAAVWLFLVDSAFVLAIPAVLLDLLYPHQRLTIWAKQCVGWSCLILSAVSLTVTGITPNTFGSDVRLLCFSHASTMDAFILAAAVPVRHFSLAKSILFSIPFFSWHLAAYGGVAINRNDKEQAIRALGAAASSARGGDCVAVAPEGTRSTSGQLLSFKKGPFHLWQSLKSAPVVPVVVYGAFELYPPGKQMSLPGKVIMEFLEPIVFSGDSSTSESRDLMSRRVRRSMLNALMKSPDNVGDTGYVSLRDRGVNILAIMFIFLLNALIVMFARNEIIRRGLSVFAFAAKFSVLCLTLTVILFGYKVYVQPRLADRKRRSKSD